MTSDCNQDHILNFLLMKEENIKLALTLEEYIPKSRQCIFTEFWANLEKFLNQKLHDHGDDGSPLKLSKSRNADPTINTYVGFGDMPDKGIPRYSIVYGWEVNGKKFESFLGIGRGIDVGDKYDPREQIIIDELKGMNYEHESGWGGHWCGWRPIYPRRLPRMDFREVSGVMALYRDNRSADQPFARDVADGLWDLFVKFHHRIEKLNEDYP